MTSSGTASGTSVVLTTGAAENDTVDVVAYGAFLIANTYTIAAADEKFATFEYVDNQIAAIPNPVAMALIFGG